MGQKCKLKPGDVVNGTYEVIRFLGRGNSAEVWEVRHLFLPASYALKLMHEEDGESAHKTSRFSAEAATLFRLHHPNIVRVHEANRTPEGRLFTVMELLDGETLTQKLAKGPIHPLRALKLAYDIACGLDAAHENGVIHRDVKPDNIFVTTDWRAILLDFAAAKFLNSGLRTTKPPDRVGTLAYMAPEQIDGTSDGRGDQYALAMVLYRLLAGKHPYARSFANHYSLMKDQFETIPEPFAAAAGLPLWLGALVARALEKPCDLRYPTMAAFLQAIHEGMRRLAAETAEGRVLVKVPLGEPPIDLTGDAALGSRKVYLAPELPAHQTTGPVLPRERVSLAPGALPDNGDNGVLFDAAPTAPLTPSTAPVPPPATSTTAPLQPMITTTRVRRSPRSRAWLAPLALALALALALPVGGGLVWRWRAYLPAFSVSLSSAHETAEPATSGTGEPGAAEAPTGSSTAVASPPPPPPEATVIAVTSAPLARRNATVAAVTSAPPPPLKPTVTTKPLAAPILADDWEDPPFRRARPATPPSAERQSPAAPTAAAAPTAPATASTDTPPASPASHRIFGTEN